MASHVVVIDASARRATVKVTPSTHLVDVLEEACKKLGFTASQYGLKHNNKPIDLSRTIRLSGLSSGAKLELVQQSRSPSVVSVALQLPESETQGLASARLTDKFPSTTTLWLVLRKFEAGVAGGGGVGSGHLNLTAKSVPVTENGPSGAGGLYYQQPVINIMGRELSTFTDLQKTLGQLGFNSGSTLLRLSFKTSETPLHEAMSQIEEFFKSQGEDVPRPPTQDTSRTEEVSAPEANSAGPEETTQPTTSRTEDIPMPDSTLSTLPTTPTTSILSRPLQVFSPPSSSTPFAASPSSTYNPSDYVPTIEHAQSHQRLLSQSSRNIRLPTEAELAAQSAAAREKLASIHAVEIKIRFPDQSSIVSRFTQTDTGKSLYDFVRECLDPSLVSEPFVIKYPAANGKGQSTVPDNADPNSKLIQGLELKGRVMMTFSWHPENTSEDVRAKKDVLKEELRQKAREIEVVDVAKTVGGQDEKEPPKGLGIEGEEKKKVDGGASGGGKKVPKWLKLPGKK